MSDVLASYLSVLLPTAKVGMFVLDSDVLSSARELERDWRFARVGFDLREGDVRTAINYYAQNLSPDLLLIETKTIDSSFTDELEKLSSVCSDTTAAIIIGPVNDVYLYRKLIDMGVSDYLVGPLSKDILVDVLSKTLVGRLGHMASRLTAFIGAKGGIGTSTFAQYASLISAQSFESKTLLLDLAGAWSFAPLAFGAEPSTTLSEIYRVMQGQDDAALKRLIFAVDDRLSILPTGMEKLLDDTIPSEQFEFVLNQLMITYPQVIVDLSSAPNSLKKTVLNRAHDIIILSSPSISSLRTARSLVQEVKNLHDGQDHNVHLILNMMEMAKDTEVRLSDIQKAVEKQPLGHVPFMPKAFMTAEMNGKRSLAHSDMKEFLSNLTSFLQVIWSKSGASQSEQHKNTKAGFLSDFISTLTKRA